MNNATEIFEKLNTQDEDTRLEAKPGNAADRTLMETICSYSNEPGLGGGTIILGVEATKGHRDDGVKIYTVTGVPDPDKIQSDIASNCSNMFNLRIRPQISTEQLHGKNVIIVVVPELEDRSKPLYFQNDGLPRGAYRRIGSTDQRCTDDDMPLFYNSADSYDSAIVEDTTLDDIDENALSRYRTLRAKVNRQAEELEYNDSDLLLALGACKKAKDGIIRLTHTGLLVFGKSIAHRRLIPAVRVDYVRVPGTTWIEHPDDRFDTIDMRGPLILLVNRAYNAIVDDLPRGFVLGEGELQANRNIGMPEKTIREAIVNALIHRSFRVNQPIQIIRYSNRIEIVNPGFSLKSEESLGEPGSVLRNPFVSAIFHETNLAETKGSGIGTMRRLMKEAGMIPPTFESDHTRNQFTIRLLLHHFLCEEDVLWLKRFDKYDLSDEQKLAIIFVREVGAIDNITYRQLCGLKAIKASRDLTKMDSQELLSSRKHGNQTYYRVGSVLMEAISEYKPLSTDLQLLSTDPPLLSTDLSALSTDPQSVNPPTSGSLSTDLQERLSRVGRRTRDKNLLKDLVVDLCKITPRSISELATLLHRTDNYVKHDIVMPLREGGKLAYTIPEMINHPDQKYKVTEDIVVQME